MYFQGLFVMYSVTNSRIHVHVCMCACVFGGYVYLRVYLLQDTAQCGSHLWVEREGREACYLHETQFCRVSEKPLVHVYMFWKGWLHYLLILVFLQDQKTLHQKRSKVRCSCKTMTSPPPPLSPSFFLPSPPPSFPFSSLSSSVIDCYSIS